jgi:hypothetical protein
MAAQFDSFEEFNFSSCSWYLKSPFPFLFGRGSMTECLIHRRLIDGVDR